MRTFNYSAIKEQKWDSDVLGLIAAIYKEAGKQELYLKQRPEELEKLVEIAKIQSTEASNAIEGIVTTSTRIRQLVEEKTTPRNRDEQEIAGYRDVLSIIHESFDAIPITQNYILQLHKILYSHMNNPLAGRTKSVQNYITATYPDGHVETLFTPLAPYETPEALDRICEEYNRVIGNMELEPLIAIPVFIHDFLCIHPFNDGNGRMSRLPHDAASVPKRFLCWKVYLLGSQNRQKQGPVLRRTCTGANRLARRNRGCSSLHQVPARNDSCGL